jgi:two-component system CheB/CheR fusion protein
MSQEKRNVGSGSRSPVKKAVSTRKPRVAAVVGIGASAGGLEALTQLLEHLPKKTGMAFVYVQHLDPSHESMLTAILSRVAPVPVQEAKQGVRVLSDVLYVIPPNKNMLIVNGTLRLAPRGRGDAHMVSIDNFFRSLAADQKERSIGIVLSGNASDGTLGLKAIKEEGGITFAQKEDSAKYPSMPHSAIALGEVDHVLTPADIARELVHISGHPRTISGGELPKFFAGEEDKRALDAIFHMLGETKGVNFAQYKLMTIKRRIVRRMVLHKLETLPHYAAYLGKNSHELELLFQDIFIHVTEFFRDREVFEYLKKHIFPALLKNRPKDEPVRMWVAGCSTGEEAYSLAIAFMEFLGSKKKPVSLQIFGTDLSDLCIEKARRGIYPKSIEAAVSKKQLRRFFAEVDGHYQISKTIRDMCVFAKQNIANDPPFSHIDLVSCRNVLIYLEPVAQKRILSTFHYALKPSGFLLLGKSEGISDLTFLFQSKDKAHKLFSKKITARRPHFEAFVLSENNPQPMEHHNAVKEVKLSPMLELSKEIERTLLSADFIPACIVIGEGMEILQFRGNLAPYLNFPSGKATWNLLKIVREDLAIELRKVLSEAKKGYRTALSKDIVLEHNGQQSMVDIEAIPLRYQRSREQYMLVVFRQKDIVIKGSSNVLSAAKGTRLRARGKEDINVYAEKLERQLALAKDQLRTVLEEEEETKEEFQSANEEILSANEELQSINEELETTKEELQSTNEELITVNEELQTRNSELGQTNNDMINILHSAHVPIIILDSGLRIRLFTPVAQKSLRIIPPDVGRSIADLKLPIKFPDLRELVLEVIASVQPKSVEVKDEEGRWYTLWVRPYRTQDNKIDGAVITLIDIDEVKRRSKIERSLSYVQGILDTMPEPLVVLDKNLRVRSANNAFYRVFNVNAKETEGVLFYELGSKQWDTPKLRAVLENVLPQHTPFQDLELECDFPHVGRKIMRVNAHQLIQEGQEEELILLVMEDITEHKFLQERTDTFMSMASHELRTPLTTIRMLVQLLQKHFEALDDTLLIGYLEKVDQQAGQLSKLATDLLDVSGIGAKKFQLDETTFDLTLLVREVIENSEMLADGHTILLEGKIAVTVNADRERISRVLVNLIMNAVKYSPDATKIIVTITKTKNTVTVGIQDFGVGIAGADQKKIFERFYRSSDKSNHHLSGLGLGLYISSTIVERHGGRIWWKAKKEKVQHSFLLYPSAPAQKKLSNNTTRLWLIPKK